MTEKTSPLPGRYCHYKGYEYTACGQNNQPCRNP